MPVLGTNRFEERNQYRPRKLALLYCSFPVDKFMPPYDPFSVNACAKVSTLLFCAEKSVRSEKIIRLPRLETSIGKHWDYQETKLAVTEWTSKLSELLYSKPVEKRAEIPATASGHLQLRALITWNSSQHFAGYQWTVSRLKSRRHSFRNVARSVNLSNWRQFLMHLSCFWSWIL